MTERGVSNDDLETWENISRGRHVIKKFSVRGDLMDEMIGGQRKFHLTTRERQLNMERAATSALDPFSNGMFTPVHLLDSTEDAEQIASNPNLIGETEMVELVKGHVKTLTKRIGDVTNPIVLQRLLQVATESDVSVGKVAAIEARIEEMSPSQVVEVESPL